MWTPHDVEYTLPIVNGIVVRRVPNWIANGIRWFATHGSVSYGVARRVRPNGYVLELTDPNTNQRCHVEIAVVRRRPGGELVMVVHDVDVG